MPELPSFLVIIAAFLVAGLVKGVIGLGLPTVSLALLTLALGLPQAMALLLVPSVVTNLWQASVGGHGTAIIGRIWPFLLMAAATVWVGTFALTRLDVAILSALLGVLLMLYAVLDLAGVRPRIAARHEPWLGPLAGTLNGVLTGMTGSFVVPGVLFLQALGLPRDMLIQAMGILFTVSTMALALALQSSALLTVEVGAASSIAVFPALLGMLLGQRIRHTLSEAVFRRLFFIGLFALGVMIVAGARG